MADTHGSGEEEWVGFDLDGTLAEYDGWKGAGHIGKPVASMVVVARCLRMLGKKIKVLTARVAPRGDGGYDVGKARARVEEWCLENLGFVPEVTCVKDSSMACLFDDRAVSVEQNTGKVLGGCTDALPKASDRAKKAVLAIAALAEKQAGDTSDVKLRKGKFSDVKAVFDELSEKDRGYVAPAHPEFYLDVPYASRTVAYDSGKPVGFADLYDELPYIGDDGRRRASVEIAVIEAARRRGIARRLAVSSIKKALKSGRFDHIDWNVARGNEASAELAKKLGFRRRGIHWHPRYTISREDFEKTSAAHHPDIDAVLNAYRDRFGIDLSHVNFKWSKHPRYSNGEISRELEDDETGGSHGRGGMVWINPDLRPVMNRFGVKGKVKDFRRWMLAHELAHEIDDKTSAANRPDFVRKMLDEAREAGFRNDYTDKWVRDKAPRKFDKELFAEYMAYLLSRGDSVDAEKKASSRAGEPSEEDLRRMYGIIQADARLSDRLRGLGFGRNGDAYRRAAIRLGIKELAEVLRDGKRVRNRIAHEPGYVPSEEDSARAARQYEAAEMRLGELARTFLDGR